MGSKNTAKYGGELARLMNSLGSNVKDLEQVQGPISDILEKIAVLHPKENSIPLCQFYEDCGFEPIIQLFEIVASGEKCDRTLLIAMLRSIRIMNGLRKLRTDHWESLPYQEPMLEVIVDNLKCGDDEMRQLYACSALSSVTMHYTEFVKHDLPALLMDIYTCESKQNLDMMHTTADYLLPTTNRAAAAHSIMKFYQSRVFYEEICKHGFIKRSMQIVIDYEKYEDDLVFCVIRYFLFSMLIHSRQAMKDAEKELGVDFFTKILVDIGNNYESRNEQIKDIVRSSCNVVSAQALKFGHMLTEQAGSTQWMEEHKGEASELLRKPLDIKRKCSTTDCSNLETKVGEFDRCSACKLTVYCTPTCQKKHWAEKHKKLCKRVRAAYKVKEVVENNDLD